MVWRNPHMYFSCAAHPQFLDAYAGRRLYVSIQFYNAENNHKRERYFPVHRCARNSHERAPDSAFL